MPIAGDIVELASVGLHPNAMRLREKALAAQRNVKRSIAQQWLDRWSPRKRQREFPIYDWQRICYAFSKLQPGTACLEVGPGRGHLTRMIAQAKLFETFAAIDIVPRPVLPKAVGFQMMSVGKMSFPDRSFDTVICMEVLEHLDDATMQNALNEIRRVCRGHLIVSVPYNETLPLPKYHQQQFTESRIKQLFPEARCSLLLKAPVMRVPWLLLEEDHTQLLNGGLTCGTMPAAQRAQQ